MKINQNCNKCVIDQDYEIWKYLFVLMEIQTISIKDKREV